MAGFLYFASGITQNVTPEKVKKWGLDYAFTGGSIENRVTNNNSPSKVAGVVFCDSTRAGGKVAGYHPDQQTWRKMPTVEGRPELWVGYWNDAKPKPEDLHRGIKSECLKGMLLDGNYWEITSTHFFDKETGTFQSDLPALLDFDDTGKLVRGPTVPEFRELEELTAPLIDAMDGKEVSLQTLYECAIALLRHRYVIDVPEVVMLGLLPFSDTSEPEEIARITLLTMRKRDVDEWVQKKTTEESGLGTVDGEAA